jgi:DnaK suppressor protein
VGTDFAALLAERLAGADARIAAAELELDGVRRAKGDSVADDEHDPEGSTLTSDWSRIAAIVNSAEAQRTAIQLAFARLKAGTYGLCLNCGGPIAEARLMARPEAELCIDCAS